MENARRWQPPVEDRTHIPPRGAILLASAAKRPNPEFAHKMLEAAHGGDVGGHGVVVVPPDDHPLQPTSLFRDGRAPMPPEFLLDRTQLGAHPVAPRFSPKQKAAASGAPADMRESEEVECLRFARAAPLSVRRSEAAELDETRLVGMHRQREPRHTLFHIRPEPLGVGLVLEACDNVVGEAHEDDLPPGMASPP